MRGDDERQVGMFSYVTLERRVPQESPLRRIRALVNQALLRMNAEVEL